MMTRKLIGTFAALAVAGYAGAATAQMDMKIGFATINDPQHAIGLEIQKRFKADAALNISPRVFPAAQIGSIPRMIEGLQFGTLEALITPPGPGRHQPELPGT